MVDLVQAVVSESPLAAAREPVDHVSPADALQSLIKRRAPAMAKGSSHFHGIKTRPQTVPSAGQRNPTCQSGQGKVLLLDPHIAIGKVNRVAGGAAIASRARPICRRRVVDRWRNESYRRSFPRINATWRIIGIIDDAVMSVVTVVEYEAQKSTSNVLTPEGTPQPHANEPMSGNAGGRHW